MIIGYIQTPETISNNLEIHSLSTMDLIYIFLNNLFILTLCLLFSIFAIPLIFSLYFWYSIGVSAKLSGIDPLIYFSTFIFHGLGEIA